MNSLFWNCWAWYKYNLSWSGCPGLWIIYIHLVLVSCRILLLFENRRTGSLNLIRNSLIISQNSIIISQIFIKLSFYYIELRKCFRRLQWDRGGSNRYQSKNIGYIQGVFLNFCTTFYLITQKPLTALLRDLA